MAQNLRAKIPEADTLTVFDVNKSSLEKFQKEAVPSNVVIAQSPREVVENSVSLHSSFSVQSFAITMMNYCSIDDLSWGTSFALSFP